MSNSWLLDGLREAKAEAQENPRLQERVDANPSGFLREPSTDQGLRFDSNNSDTDKS